MLACARCGLADVVDRRTQFRGGAPRLRRGRTETRQRPAPAFGYDIRGEGIHIFLLADQAVPVLVRLGDEPFTRSRVTSALLEESASKISC